VISCPLSKTSTPTPADRWLKADLTVAPIPNEATQCALSLYEDLAGDSRG
jgi:hypothetical protein